MGAGTIASTVLGLAAAAALVAATEAGSQPARQPRIDLAYVDDGAVFVDYSADRPAPQTSPNETNTAAAHRRWLGVKGSEPRWSPDGSELVFVNPVGKKGSELWVVRVDGRGARRLTHSPPGRRDLHPAWSPSGSSVAFVRVATSGGDRAELWLVGATGHGAKRLVASAFAETPSWAPDGSRLAFDSPEGLAVVPFEGGAVKVLGKAQSTGAAWAPDGSAIAASCPGACLFSPDTGRSRKILKKGLGFAFQWRPDSRRLTFVLCCSASKVFGGLAADLYTVGADGSGLQKLVRGVGPISEVTRLGAAWSADSKLFAYVSTDEAIGDEIVVRPAGLHPFLLGTGTDLAWRPAR